MSKYGTASLRHRKLQAATLRSQLDTTRESAFRKG
jgi:hypothetical protein